MVREIPDIVVSTTEALVKCEIFMVSIAFAYAILSGADLGSGESQKLSVSTAECVPRLSGA